MYHDTDLPVNECFKLTNEVTMQPAVPQTFTKP